MLITWSDARAAFVGATRDISEQHVAMSERIRRLPRESIVAVTDAGGMAYLGGRRTVDVIGLTTNRASDYYLFRRRVAARVFGKSPVAKSANTLRDVSRRVVSSLDPLWSRRRSASRPAAQQSLADAPLELWPREETRLGLGAAERPVVVGGGFPSTFGRFGHRRCRRRTCPPVRRASHRGRQRSRHVSRRKRLRRPPREVAESTAPNR